MHYRLGEEGAAMFIEGSADKVGGDGGGVFARGELFEVFKGAARHDAGVFGGADAGADGDL